MSDQQAYYDKVSELMNEVDSGSGWEYDFIMSLAEYEEKGLLFSVSQQNKIDELYEKLC